MTNLKTLARDVLKEMLSVVQHMRAESHTWDTIAAFDATAAARMYRDECLKANPGGRYQVVRLTTTS